MWMSQVRALPPHHTAPNHPILRYIHSLCIVECMGTKRSVIWTMPAEEFAGIVSTSKSLSHVANRLGQVAKGSGWYATKSRISALGLNIDHFLKRGQWPNNNPSLDEDIVFRENSPHCRAVARKHYRRKFPMICKECGQLPEWKGTPLVMVLDHVNGIANDHRLENLRWLCPNCNSQMETFAGRNVKRKRKY
jgi:predicted nucleic acid-binding Zn ribbon protein